MTASQTRLDPPAWTVSRVPADLRVAAAERLVTSPDRARAARRLVESAERHGIDLDLMWGAIGPGRRTVGQVCLAVPSAGRTAMLFLSAPSPDRALGRAEEQTERLTRVLRTALREIPQVAGTPLRLAQILVEPDQAWAEAACRGAGMTWVGRLQFMRLAWPARGEIGGAAPEDAWPAGVRVEPLGAPGGSGLDAAARSALGAALEASYEDTLDCPELCGLRATDDVIDSHMATGAFDPSRWWIVRMHDRPEGCCLLTHCPGTRSVELVYLGLSGRLRGMGLGWRVLRHALSRLGAVDARELTCAVDTRNAPALRLYERAGFRAFGARTGFVSALATPGA